MTPHQTNGTSEPMLDALIVGAGFSGLSILHKLRQHGFAVKIFEAGQDLGGTWYWNRYPGARVDSSVPVYQLQFGDEHEKKIWDDFEWSERFPCGEEIMRYFHHADKKLEFRKDVHFGTLVKSAHFDDIRNQWLVKSESKHTGQMMSTWTRHLILCTGALAKSYMPPFKGLDTFKGELLHSAHWPEHEVDFRGKRVAIIGTGASAIQIIQEIGPVVEHLTVYQRTPNLAIPMRQRWRGPPHPGRNTDEDGTPWQFPEPDEFNEAYKIVKTTFGGQDFDGLLENWKDTSPAQREAVFQSLWNGGGLRFWAGFADLVYDEEANDGVYAFWAKNVRARINDPKKKDLLAPLKKPHAWGTKRPSLEQNYYEVMDQSNVDMINVKESPILRITPDGVETKNEGVVPVDILLVATGFDAQTGAILAIDIRNGSGRTLYEKWDQGIRTLFGMSVAGFPNMFFFYGPQAPTVFANGPTCAAVQAEWLEGLIVTMRAEGKVRVEPTEEGEADWVQQVRDRWYESLMHTSESWYQGANIPGKRREPLSYYGGMVPYQEKLRESANNNYKGFHLT